MGIITERIAEILPEYIYQEDSYKDAQGRGFIYRFLEALGIELDQELMPFIDDFVNKVVDIDQGDSNFITYWEDYQGDIENYTLTESSRRNVIKTINSIYGIRGTFESVRAVLLLRGLEILGISNITQNKYRYDSGTRYDEDSRYDTGCTQCSTVILKTFQEVDTTDKIIPRLLELVLPFDVFYTFETIEGIITPAIVLARDEMNVYGFHLNNIADSTKNIKLLSGTKVTFVSLTKDYLDLGVRFQASVGYEISIIFSTTSTGYPYMFSALDSAVDGMSIRMSNGRLVVEHNGESVLGTYNSFNDGNDYLIHTWWDGDKVVTKVASVNTGVILDTLTLEVDTPIVTSINAQLSKRTYTTDTFDFTFKMLVIRVDNTSADLESLLDNLQLFGRSYFKSLGNMLVAYSFSEGIAGNNEWIYDYSGEDNHGVIVSNGVSGYNLLTYSEAGGIQSALSNISYYYYFDGVNDAVSFGNRADLELQDFLIESEFFFSSKANAGAVYTVQSNTGTDDGIFLRSEGASVGQTRFYIRINNGLVPYITYNHSPGDFIKHRALKIGTSLKIWINDVLRVNATLTSSLVTYSNSNRLTQVGRRGGSNDFFLGVPVSLKISQADGTELDSFYNAEGWVSRAGNANGIVVGAPIIQRLSIENDIYPGIRGFLNLNGGLHGGSEVINLGRYVNHVIFAMKVINISTTQTIFELGGSAGTIGITGGNITSLFPTTVVESYNGFTIVELSGASLLFDSYRIKEGFNGYLYPLEGFFDAELESSLVSTRKNYIRTLIG